MYARLFETRFAAFAGARRAVAVDSGTAALHAALKVLDVEGGEVLTTPLTNVATNQAVLLSGAKPVFCDVEPDTGNIDPCEVAARLSPRARAVLVVHLHGHACDMGPILAAARKRRVPVVEDCCQAVGGTYKGRPLGTLGELGCFSFGRSKSLSTVRGGAVVFGKGRWNKRLLSLCRLGHKGEDGDFACRPDGVEELGLHSRMSDVEAVIGLAQLRRWKTLKGRLDRAARRYRAGLAGLELIELPGEKPYARRGYSHFCVRVPGGRRGALAAFLRKRGIDAEVSLYPNHFYNLFRKYRRGLPEAERLWKELLYLPYYPDLRDRDIDRVTGAVRRFK